MKRLISFAALLCALIPADALAQSICNDDETPFACLERLVPTPQPPTSNEIADVAATAASQQISVKRKTETGALEQLAGLGSSVKDFLPLLRLSGAIGDAARDDTTGVVAVALNTRMLNTTLSGSFALNRSVRMRSPLY